MRAKQFALVLAIALSARVALAADADVWDRVQHGTVDSGGVKIHYASLGSGPPVVLIHGFPDFWYTWRHQMAALADAGFRAVAIDQRGYDLSDSPDGVEQYAMPLLVGDVVAVINKGLGAPSATVVGHDWGGVVAWQVALNAPEVVDRLVILNLPHPNGLARELATNPRQLANSAYARGFQAKTSKDPDVFFGGPMTPQSMASWVRDPSARARYVEAFSRSDLDAMLNYYKANYPRPPYEARWAELQRNPGPKLRMPVLIFHGLNDTALDAKALNDTWEWLERDLTLVTVPGSDHFVQQDAAELVSDTLVWWLRMRAKK
ncbi:MAG TPA: alpha/beta hydrolase [Myxococcota bacterium]|jgi:pimeloyl-ACP methyl ester carboxylesterase